MSTNKEYQLAIIERSAEKASIWLKDVASELGEDDRQYAYRVLRAVLHVLPTLIRGIYYEDWDPGRRPMPPYTADTLLEHVVSEGRLSGETEASVAVTAVATVLRRRLSPDVIDAIVAVMPDALRVLIEA